VRHDRREGTLGVLGGATGIAPDLIEAYRHVALKQLDCDIVGGCGVAGVSAALTALEAGASVIVLERATKEDRGGNPRWTEAILRVTADGDRLIMRTVIPRTRGITPNQTS
jgi:hypothetical protein